MTLSLRSGLQQTWTARSLVKAHSVQKIALFASALGASLNTCSQEVGEDSLNRLSEIDGPLDSATYASLLRWCGCQKALSNGKRVHEHIVRNGHGRNTFLESLLVQMYGKCGALEYALAQFAGMRERNLFSWNFTVRACAQHGLWACSLRLFKDMQQEAVLPDKFTFVSMLSACVCKGALFEGKRMHALIINSAIVADIAVATSVVSMYGKCGDSSDGLKVFDGMAERDVVTWNAVIAGYSQNGNVNQALYFFDKMQQEGVMPNMITFVSILDACANQAELKEGERLHACILCNILESEVVVGNALINMYGKCGSLENAWMLFDHMSKRNVVSWTAMITSCYQHRQIEDALQLFNQMISEGTLPGNVTFVTILSACGRNKLLVEGERIHACLPDALDVVVGTALLNMYGRCGALEDAQRLFGTLHERDLVAWNAMITVSAQHDYIEEAAELLQKMQFEKVVPDAVTYISILSACVSEARLDVGKQVHACVMGNRFESNTTVGNSLITMYGKCGNVEDARESFDRMPQHDVVSWNAMMAVYSLHGKGMEALGLFDNMQLNGINPDQITFVSVLEAYECFPVTKELINTDDFHAIERTAAMKRDQCTAKSGKCRVVEDAGKLFDHLHERDVNLWNALIPVYIRHDECCDALLLFGRMQEEGVLPNVTTFINVLSAWGSRARLAEGKRMHSCCINGDLASDIPLQTALISMYGKCGSVDDSKGVFDEISTRNVVLWTAMIAVYVQNDRGHEALKIFPHMLETNVLPNKVTLVSVLIACSSKGAVNEGKKVHASVLSMGLEADVVIETALVFMYAKCGCLDISYSIFYQMSNHDVIFWNAMILMFGHHGLGREALSFFVTMEQKGVLPDKVTFVSVLTACSHSGLVDEAFHCFNSMVQDHCIYPAVDHYVCMIDLLGRTGRLEEAMAVIDDMPAQPNSAPFMALLSACRQLVDLKSGAWAALHVFELDPINTAPYVILSNMHVAEQRRW